MWELIEANKTLLFGDLRTALVLFVLTKLFGPKATGQNATAQGDGDALSAGRDIHHHKHIHKASKEKIPIKKT